MIRGGFDTVHAKEFGKFFYFFTAQAIDNSWFSFVVLDEFDNSKSLLQDKGEFYQMKIDDYVLKVNNNGFVDSISNSNIHITFVNGKAIPQKVSNS